METVKNSAKQNDPKASSTMAFLAEMDRNANLSKYVHFNEADRQLRHFRTLSVPVILINIVLSSAFFFSVTDGLPVYVTWVSAFLALIAASLATLTLFFGFERRSESHRRLANKYLALAKECQFVAAGFTDDIYTKDQIAEKITQIRERYDDINSDAEGYPTAPTSYAKALESEKLRRADIKIRHGLDLHVDSKEATELLTKMSGRIK